MTREEAEKYADNMTYRDAINNLMKARSIPYRKATFIKINELLKALEQEPRKGHWITKPHVYGVTYCSECDFELKIDNTNYCPNCGAKMESEEI